MLLSTTIAITSAKSFSLTMLNEKNTSLVLEKHSSLGGSDSFDTTHEPKGSHRGDHAAKMNHYGRVGFEIIQYEMLNYFT
jgi:hypothetical protein